ncbi:MAG: hypothetical protein MN733_10675 [Nitrososphaera sp.]|nr:hypothetical protein [Nitrososphaera sp.]
MQSETLGGIGKVFDRGQFLADAAYALAATKAKGELVEVYGRLLTLDGTKLHGEGENAFVLRLDDGRPVESKVTEWIVESGEYLIQGVVRACKL